MLELLAQLAGLLNPVTCAEKLEKILKARPDPVLNAPGTDALQLTVVWHRWLFDAIRPDPEAQDEDGQAKRPVLCGLNFVNDEIYYLASGNDLNDLMASMNCAAPGEAKRHPETLEDVLACLLEMIRHPEREGKYRPADTLVGQLREAASEAGLESVHLLGGAAGNMAYALSHLGWPTTVHGPYHAEGLNWSELHRSARFMNLDPADAPFSQAAEAVAGLPCKTTVGFQISPTWTHDGLKVTADRAARALFIGKNPVIPGKPPARQKVRIHAQGKDPEWEREPNTGWPDPGTFSSIAANGSNLDIVLPDQSDMKRTLDRADAPIALAILGGLGGVLDQGVLNDMQVRQIAGLRSCGIAVHTEVSGRCNFTLLKSLIDQAEGDAPSGPRKWSIGLNQEDIAEITGTLRGASRKYREQEPLDTLFAPRGGDESLFRRFLRARHLLQRLDVSWVYVHGNDLDIAVWNDEALPGAGARLRQAMLLAKGAVIAGMIRRLVPPALMPFVQAHLRDTAIAAGGLGALVRFAEDIARWQTPIGEDGTIATCAEQKLARRFLEQDGYLVCRDGTGVAAAPVYWPEAVAPYLSATGAGDITSAIVAASMWA